MGSTQQRAAASSRRRRTPPSPAGRVTPASISRWVKRYVRAWNSNAPEDIGQLFAVAALYRHTPFASPWRGRAAITRQWLARQDAPGTTSFRFEVLAISLDTAIVRGWTRYHDSKREYSNVWLLRFDRQGRCREFTEWWMQRPLK